MKRSHNAEQLSDAELEKWLSKFPLNNLPTDTLYHMIFEIGLSVRQLMRLCSISWKFRSICLDGGIWDRVFIDKFVATELPVTSESRREYIDTDKFRDWKRDSARMPERGVHLFAYAIVNKSPAEFSLYRQMGARKLRLKFVAQRGGVRNASLFALPAGTQLNWSSLPNNERQIFGGSAGVSGEEIVYVCYQLLQIGWVPHDNAKNTFLGCAACGSTHIRFICKDCKNFAVCSYACSDSVAATHDAVCH